jgi:hypothetical protein
MHGMRAAALALSLAVVAVVACKSRVTSDQELCAKAAAMFEKCEELDLGSGSDAALTRELMIDRWRGLCRAVHTGRTDHLMQNTRELFQAMDEGTRAGLRLQAECTAKAATCVEYAACDD